MRFGRAMIRVREQLRAELTSLVEQRRADYQRLKADNEITRAELSKARAAYKQALLSLSWLLEHPSGHPSRQTGGTGGEKQTQVFEGTPCDEHARGDRRSADE